MRKSGQHGTAVRAAGVGGRVLATLLLLGTERDVVGSEAAAQPPRSSLTEGVAGYKYMCHVPLVRTNAAQRLPLILFLHGACRDEDLSKFRHFGPLKYALAHADSPFIVVCPATARGWTLPALVQLLDHIQATFPVDPNRVYLTGYSMGGHGTWLFATAYPQRFAAIAPAAGAGNPQEAAHKLQRVPVWIFHGVNDSVVPFSYGETMAKALEAAGAEVKTTFYPDRGHEIADKPYQEPELYAWFLQHRRGTVPIKVTPRPPASVTNPPVRAKSSAP